MHIGISQTPDLTVRHDPARGQPRGSIAYPLVIPAITSTRRCSFTLKVTSPIVHYADIFPEQLTRT